MDGTACFFFWRLISINPICFLLLKMPYLFGTAQLFIIPGVKVFSYRTVVLCGKYTTDNSNDCYAGSDSKLLMVLNSGIPYCVTPI